MRLLNSLLRVVIFIAIVAGIAFPYFKYLETKALPETSADYNQLLSEMNECQTDEDCRDSGLDINGCQECGTGEGINKKHSLRFTELNVLFYFSLHPKKKYKSHCVDKTSKKCLGGWSCKFTCLSNICEKTNCKGAGPGVGTKGE